MFQKRRRLVDNEAMQEARERPCAVCGARAPSDPHHLKSRGSGGGDEPDNLLSLCRRHHTEVHQIGGITFLNKYPHIRAIMKHN